ncbi:hypothetical protein [Streptomyces sp. NBC_01198]|uniref:hypothetical protein n=1 Tax=Streptomyces sp. NBC_01198 TaxID=2903769 RepID=UPI002E12C943|nr:hypothetical protein OG702_13425 [Streptomyces sp. NBC_01198]
MGMVTFVDETTSGETRGSWGLDVTEERLSARELIRRRVRQEVAEYNARQPEVFNGLVQPTDAERTLNGYRLRAPRRLDAERQCELALDAFGRNGFLLLVADRQVEELDDQVDLPAGTEVVFLKLVPLVGG